MKLAEIRAQDTSLEREDLTIGATSWHESLLRSYHIVAKVKELLERGTPADVVIEIIEDLQDAPIDLPPQDWRYRDRQRP